MSQSEAFTKYSHQKYIWSFERIHRILRGSSNFMKWNLSYWNNFWSCISTLHLSLLICCIDLCCEENYLLHWINLHFRFFRWNMKAFLKGDIFSTTPWKVSLNISQKWSKHNHSIKRMKYSRIPSINIITICLKYLIREILSHSHCEQTQQVQI